MNTIKAVRMRAADFELTRLIAVLTPYYKCAPDGVVLLAGSEKSLPGRVVCDEKGVTALLLTDAAGEEETKEALCA